MSNQSSGVHPVLYIQYVWLTKAMGYDLLACDLGCLFYMASNVNECTFHGWSMILAII